MRIEVTRSGGFTGVTLRNAVETSSLGPRGEELERLANAARQAHVPRAALAHPDGLSYEIRIDGESYRMQDGTMPAEWSKLIEAVVTEHPTT